MLGSSSAFGVILENDLAVHYRVERKGRGVAALLVRGEEVLDRICIHASHARQLLRGITTQTSASDMLRNESKVSMSRVVDRSWRIRRPGVHDQTRNDGVRRVSEVIIVNRYGARGLTPEHHPRRITSERRDVLPTPFDRRTLVEEAQVLFLQAAGIGETEDVDAVVEGDDDVVCRTVDPLRGDLVGDILAAGLETAAVDEIRTGRP